MVNYTIIVLSPLCPYFCEYRSVILWFILSKSPLRHTASSLAVLSPSYTRLYNIFRDIVHRTIKYRRILVGCKVKYALAIFCYLQSGLELITK